MLVYVLDKDGNPLMPTHRLGRVRHWLKDGEAIIVSHQPFTIQFIKTTEHHTQDLNLGIVKGVQNLGKYIKLNSGKVFSTKTVRVLRHVNGYLVETN